MIWKTGIARLLTWSRFSKQMKWPGYIKYMCTKQNSVLSSINMNNNALLNLLQKNGYLTMNQNLFLTNAQKSWSSFYMQICLFHNLNNFSSEDLFLKQQECLKEIRRYKKRKHSKQDELEDESSSDSESDDETSDSESDDDDVKEEIFPEYPEDSHIKSLYTDKLHSVNSTRCDAILRKALNLKANEVVTNFFAGNIYVNDKKIAKKNVKLKEGDYTDISLVNSEDKTLMKRVRILKIKETKTKKGKQTVLCRVWYKLFESDKKS